MQFDDALVSSCVVTYRKTRPGPDSRMLYSFGGSLSEPRIENPIETATLDSSTKWLFRAKSNGGNGEENAVRLDQLFEIKRGLATGANSFFIMSEEKAREFDIPQRFLRPILPSRYLQDDVITSDKAGLPSVSKRLFLLDCTEPPEIVKSRYPGLWSYLEQGREQGQ